MKEKRPVLVSYIADLIFLNVLFLIVSFIPKVTNKIEIIKPKPTFFNITFKVLVILILLIISYGLLRLKRWGYWLMITYNMFFLVVSYILLLKITEQSFYNPGFTVSILGLILILSAKRYFVKENNSI